MVRPMASPTKGRGFKRRHARQEFIEIHLPNFIEIYQEINTAKENIVKPAQTCVAI